MSNGLQEYHLNWLSVNSGCTEGWLREKLKEGFHLHHLDGDHSNNDPANLMLIWGGDHMFIHWGEKMRIKFRPGDRRVDPLGPAFRASYALMSMGLTAGEIYDVAEIDVPGAKAKRFALASGRPWPVVRHEPYSKKGNIAPPDI